MKKDLPHSAGHTSTGCGEREVGQKCRATSRSHRILQTEVRERLTGGASISGQVADVVVG